MKNKKEYRNMKYLNGSCPVYEGELWINDKFIQHVTLTEVQYRQRLLVNKLETLLDAETFNEVKKVMELKYQEGFKDADLQQ
jgi:hypothetical protein